MLVLPKPTTSPHSNLKTSLRETSLRALREAARVCEDLTDALADIVADTLDKYPLLAKYAAHLPRLARQATDRFPILERAWRWTSARTMAASAVVALWWMPMRARIARRGGALLTSGVTLARACEVAALGAVLLGLSASASAGTASTVSTVTRAAVAVPATGCMVAPAVAQMVTTAEIAAPMQYGLRRDSSGQVFGCSVPGMAIPTPKGGVPARAGQVIVVELSQEWLYAYQDGALVLASPVSSGRPDLDTPTGTFTVEQKLADSMFTSPWPVGSPYYYAPLHVNYGLLFLDGGFYIHDSPWRATYGPGSEVPHTLPDGTSETGSHGCVEMPTSTAARLYAWAQMGATVIIRP